MIYQSLSEGHSIPVIDDDLSDDVTVFEGKATSIDMYFGRTVVVYWSP
jgi:hypothetical protein